MRNSEKNIKKLIKDVNAFIDKHESRYPKFKGCSNITRADLDTLIMRAEFMLRGSYNLMKVFNQNVRDIFEKYDIDPEYNNSNYSW